MSLKEPSTNNSRDAAAAIGGQRRFQGASSSSAVPDEFGLLRALAAAQRQGAELVARAELAVADVEARTSRDVAAILDAPGPGELDIAALASELEALLAAERDAVGARLQRLEAQLAHGRAVPAPTPAR